MGILRFETYTVLYSGCNFSVTIDCDPASQTDLVSAQIDRGL
jgi:hypothetical protein